MEVETILLSMEGMKTIFIFSSTQSVDILAPMVAILSIAIPMHLL
jgi:hypothetical protein